MTLSIIFCTPGNACTRHLSVLYLLTKMFPTLKILKIYYNLIFDSNFKIASLILFCLVSSFLVFINSFTSAIYETILLKKYEFDSLQFIILFIYLSIIISISCILPFIISLQLYAPA